MSYLADTGGPCKPQLRPYQVDAVQRARRALRTCSRLLLVAPTGAGKTIIFSNVIASAHGKGSRVIVVAHRRELIHQSYRKVVAAGVPAEAVGILMADDPLSNPQAPIQIASVATWINREPPPANLVVVDECHRSLSATYLRLIRHYSNLGAKVLGVTATPYRADGGGLGDVYEALEVVASPRQLIAEGYLVEPRIFSAPPETRPDLTGVRVRGGDYVESDLGERMNESRLVGGIVEHWRTHAEGRRTVAFAVTVAHSRAIAAAFVESGIPAEHLDGETPMAERDAILRRLESGSTLVVSNCGVLCEGWDQPAVKCAVLARPTKSTGLYLQQAGRILRPWEGVGAVILDHAGNALVHGLPQDDRDFALDTTEKARPRKTTKECPECGAVLPIPATACEVCGHAFIKPEPEEPPAVEAAGSLVEIDPALFARMRDGWRDLCCAWRQENERRLANGERAIKPGWVWHRFTERFGCRPPAGCKLPPEIADDATKAAALDELHQTARDRGYKRGWALHRYRERFGHYPGRWESRP